MPEIPTRDTPALQVAARRADLRDIDPAAIGAAQDLLRTAKRMLGAFAEAFAAHGLSPGRYSMLMALDAARPSLAPSEIADRLGVTRATITGLIEGLVRDGLVADAPDAADRRRKAVALTPKGEALLEVVLPDIFQRMADLTSPLSEPERLTLQKLLGRIEEALP